MTVRAQEYGFGVVVVFLMMLTVCDEASAQPVPGGVCRSVADRDSEVGCWIMANQPVGQLTSSEIFWHLDVYPTRAAAEQAKGSRGTVIESLGKVWLLSIEAAGWRPAGGERVAEIGPLPVIAGEQY